MSAGVSAWIAGTWSPDGLPQVVVWAVVYFVAVGVTCLAMEAAPAFKPNKKLLDTLSALNNIGMCGFSAYMFFGVVAQSYSNWQERGFDPDLLVCDKDEVYKKGAEHWYFLFFLSKYMEYIDTVFLILNRKYSHSVGWYLQVYHHSTTASIAWVAWWTNMPFSWFGIMSNTFVHIVMYAYFAITVYWKGARAYGHLVTYVQLAQFWIAVTSAAYTTWLHNIQDANVRCNSDKNGIWFVAFMYFSYLVFFLVFHYSRSAALKKSKAAKGAAATTAESAAKKVFAPCMMNQDQEENNATAGADSKKSK